MRIDENSDKPIFLQIAQGIEDAILTGAFPEGGQVPSITEFSVKYTINPATALKGINLLVESGILQKKRGVGMFVAQGAMEKLKEQRREGFYDHYVVELVGEAKRIGVGRDEVKTLVDRGFAQKNDEGSRLGRKGI